MAELMSETARHERFAYGVWASIDEQRVRRGQLPFQDQMAWDMSIRGGVFLRPWFNPVARFPFTVAVWDPKTVVYESGNDGLEFVARHYYAPKYSVTTTYKVTPEALDQMQQDENGNVEVHDVWWMEYDAGDNPHVWNLVTAGGQELLAPREYRDLDHIPVYLIRSFGAEVEPNPDYHYTTQRTLDEWESIYTTNRDLYPWMNRILTLYSIYLRNNAIGPWFAKQTGLSDEQLRNAIRPFNVIQSNNPNATFGPVNPPEMADAVKELFTYAQGAEQRGGVPYSIFGQIPFQLSGFAVNQLQGSVSITAGQIAKMMGFAYQLCTDEMIQQFKQRGKNVTVSGKDTRSQQFIDEIKAAELRAKYSLQANVTPEMPVDKLQEAQVALAWKQVGIDPITIGEEVLHLADMREIIKRMIAYGIISKELSAQAEAELQAMQQGGAGAEGAPGGPPPEMLPPESQGLLTQHTQFQRSRQQTPQQDFEAAGFTR